MDEEILEKETAEEAVEAAAEAAEAIEEAAEEIEEAVEEAAEDEAEDPEKAAAEAAEKARLKRKTLIGDIVFFVGCFIVLYLLFTVFPPYYVDGDSMNQTLRSRAFGFGTIVFTPDYGDIVVLHGDSGKTNDSDFIKRIVGKPGDILEIKDGVLTRNGELITEDYAYYDPEYTFRTNESQYFELQEGEYFVMGDNRFHSMDSRYFGPITRSEMKCKMLFFLWGKKR